MPTHDEYLDGGKWTPDEDALFAALPRERSPSHDLKQRTIEAVRRDHFQPRRATAPNRRFALLAAAAAFVLFITGALVGYAAGRRATPPDNQARMSTRQEVAQADSATINALPVRHVVWY